MGLETGTYISDLDGTNPVSGDGIAQGDDHLRLIKTVLKSTFPNASKAIYFPSSSTKSVGFSVLSTEMNMTFLVSTASGNVIATLPTLVSGDAGWHCYIMKTSTDTSAIFITPPSGTIQSGALSGLAKTRRAIPGIPCRVFWTGSAWIAERAERSPVGSILDFDGATAPVGYELPNGQTLAGASGSIYPDYFAMKGSLVTRDVTGRVVAMLEPVPLRLTTLGGGIDGTTLGSAGGLQKHTLVEGEIPAHSHSGTTGGQSADHTHLQHIDTLYDTSNPAIQNAAGSNMNTTQKSTEGTSNDHTHAFTTDSAGGSLSHFNTQPTIVLNKILVVE